MNSLDFEERLNYTFRDRGLLEQALTHSSCGAQGKVRHNQRLEFLGDAIFDAVISEYLYRNRPDLSEGELTKMRAVIVCEGSLAQAGEACGIGGYLKMSKGEEQSGGRTRPSIIADGMEAVIGAVFLDGSFEEARRFVLEQFRPVIGRALEGALYRDYKSALQERLQEKGKVEIVYTLERSEGPAHRKKFFVSVAADGRQLGEGSGKSKKEAEQNAARDALERGEAFVL